MNGCECNEQSDAVCAHAPDPCFAPATLKVWIDGEPFKTCGSCLADHGVLKSS